MVAGKTLRQGGAQLGTGAGPLRKTGQTSQIRTHALDVSRMWPVRKPTGPVYLML
jgi:hypothetical protein